MQFFLTNILAVSLTSSGIALLILLIRKLFGKETGAWWRSIIWVLLLVRLCIPMVIDSPIGVLNESAQISDYTQVSPIPNANANNSTTTDLDSPILAADTPQSTTPSPKIDWIKIAFYIYLSGAMIFLLRFIAKLTILNMRVNKMPSCTAPQVNALFEDTKNAMGIKRKIWLVTSKTNKVPAMCGLFSPCVVIPENLTNTQNKNQLEYIFIHELTHYKQKDIFKLWLTEIAVSIHWFNPILHLIKNVIVQDIEIACDEKVLNVIGKNNYAEYGSTLVCFSTKHKNNFPMVTTTNFAGKRGNNLKERLIMIKKYNRKKTLIIGLILALVLSVTLIACTTLGTDENLQPMENTPEPTTNPQSTDELDSISTESMDTGEQEVAVSKDVRDINNSSGTLIERIAQLIDGNIPLGDLIEEFSLPYEGDAFRFYMCTLTDEYTLSLFVEQDIDRELNLDYSSMGLVLENTTDNWLLTNPTSEEVVEYMQDEYFAQREEWKAINVESRYEGNFLQVNTPNNGMITIQISDDVASELVNALKNPDGKIIINDYKDTPQEYSMYGAEIFLEDMNYKYPVPLWSNSRGSALAFGYAAEPIPVSQYASDIVMNLITANMNFEKLSLDEISDLVSVELILDGESKGIVTDSSDLKEIENMLKNAENLNGGSGCPFTAKLILTKSDGSTLELIHATDSCSVFVLGTADYYKYDNRDKLLEYFGMTEFYTY